MQQRFSYISYPCLIRSKQIQRGGQLIDSIELSQCRQLTTRTTMNKEIYTPRRDGLSIFD